MLLSPRALKSLMNIEKISPRVMCATFRGNSRKMNLSYCRPTNASNERDIITFCDGLFSLGRHIPKHIV